MPTSAFILERDLVGFRNLEKNAAWNLRYRVKCGAPKNRPRDKCNFFFKQRMWNVVSVTRIKKKTALRNRLGEESLDTLMTISIEGPPLSKFDCHEACQVCVRKRTGKVEKSRSESRVTEAFFQTCGLKEIKLFILMLDESKEYM